MQRDSNRILRIRQNARRTIALMDVTIEDQYFMYTAALQQVMTDHGQVIENAETGRIVVVRMMGAARQMTGQAVRQGLFGGQQRAAYGADGTSRERFAPGQAEAALVFA